MTGVELIAAERYRQIYEEGWTAGHDSRHPKGELAQAAASYAVASRATVRSHKPPPGWPWAKQWWKPTSPIRMLVKAGALIAAEIDRRLSNSEGP